MQDGLDPSKLTSIDEHGDHIYIIPAEVRGFFRKHRTWTQLILLAIFLILPWIYIGGHQAIHLDIPDRQFTFFGVIFKAHETPLLFFILAITTLGLALVTSVWGRVWCGWACPQTVFIDAVYRRIEQWTEGNYIERRKLHTAPMSFEKFRKKTFKWFLFVFVSSLIAHSFMAYFAGSRELIQMMQGSPSENWNYFLLVSFFTAITLFDFAWFREQFCVIMCPYGRIQSVLMESDTLAVVYDTQRGEPRKGRAQVGEKSGDCVACNRCVQVCPTGIDIRNGLQMECITCTACIDACDEIMEKVKKPKGLIGYKTLDGSPFRIFKFKTIAYAVLIALAVFGLVYNLSTRQPVNVTLLRAIDTPFTVIQENDGTISLNHFRLHLTNQTSLDANYKITLNEEAQKLGITLTVAQNPVLLKADASETWHFFIKAPVSQFPKNGQIKVKVTIQKFDSEDVKFEKELTLLGPKS